MGEGRLLVALYGPTSSGKTALSIDLAERIERELGRRVIIISADSRQVYRYMDIGTSKTTKPEMRGIRHEMIDVLEPIRKFPAAGRFSAGLVAIEKARVASGLRLGWCLGAGAGCSGAPD